MNVKTRKAMSRINHWRERPGDAERVRRHTERSKRCDEPKPLPQRTRRHKAAHPPTWPRTDDQKRQGRPLIVIHPVRQLVGRGSWKSRVKPYLLYGGSPKHAIDAAVLAGD